MSDARQCPAAVFSHRIARDPEIENGADGEATDAELREALAELEAERGYRHAH